MMTSVELELISVSWQSARRHQARGYFSRQRHPPWLVANLSLSGLRLALKTLDMSTVRVTDHLSQISQASPNS